MHISAVLGIERQQWRRVATLWLILFLITLAAEVGSDSVTALFLERVGTENLPPAFALEAALRLLATALYFVLARRMTYGRMMVGTTLLYAVTVGALMLALQTEGGASLTLFYALEQVASKLIVLHWGVYIVDFFTVGESATAFPVIYSSQPLGAMVAGLLLVFNPSAEVTPLFGVALLAGVGAALALRLAGRVRADSLRIAVAPPPAARSGPAWGAAWRYVVRAPVVRQMAIATVALVVVRMFLDLGASFVLEARYDSALGISIFLGYYKMGANVLVFLLQAFCGARMMRRFSPPRVNLSYAFLTAAGFFLLAALPGTPALIFVKAVSNELKTILKTPFSVMMYGAMADYARAPARIAVFGVIVPLSGVAGGLAMMAIPRGFMSVASLALCGALVSVAFIAVSLLQNRAYKLALVEMLQAKLELQPHTHGTSSLLRVPDGRLYEIRAARSKPGYLFSRSRLAGRLFPELLTMVPTQVAALDQEPLRERLEEVLLLVELYRPLGADGLRRLLVAALADHRSDLGDNAMEVINSILPPAMAVSARALLAAGLERGIELKS